MRERLFAALDRQLVAKDLFVETGTLIDASLIEVDVKRPLKDEGEVSARDMTPGRARKSLLIHRRYDSRCDCASSSPSSDSAYQRCRNSGAQRIIRSIPGKLGDVLSKSLHAVLPVPYRLHTARTGEQHWRTKRADTRGQQRYLCQH
ncbi:MAG: hypothetical protein ACM3Q0_05575 [Bacteroidota bacterium]